jgi:hypothetical protein
MSGQFAVVVPVNDEAALSRNVLASPGLEAIGAEIVLCRGAKSAAAAFQAGLKRTVRPWILFCHQDVFFPEGAGAAIERTLAEIHEADTGHTILGFCGMELDRRGEPVGAGTVVDRGHLLDWPESNAAISIDEFAVVLHRECKYKIDAELGWHLWATDLCLQAMADGRHARIVRVLLHHNSTLAVIPPEFHASGWRLVKKYPHRRIHTLNGIGEASRAQR